MIAITGAAGFIGSNMVSRLNAEGFKDLVLVDDFSKEQKRLNYEGKRYRELVDRMSFDTWLKANHRFVQFVFHLGARTDTTEFNTEVFNRLNLQYSKNIWITCTDFGIPMVYASSAATYGAGENGYSDSHEIIPLLKPLNPYGDSKNEFDKWVLTQQYTPSFWAGLKFFNVYGPNEFHKGRMASVVYHTFNQIRETGKVKLFRSHNPSYKDGEQLRDFIYVMDVVSILYWFLHHRENPGIYNTGTGRARTFMDLATSSFRAAGMNPFIEFIDTPVDIRDKYQYYTCADMGKLRSVGYDHEFSSLEEGISDYIKNYLIPGKYI